MPTDTDHHDPCAFLGVMEVVGGKWRGTIIYCLTTGSKRFNVLRKAIAPISPKVLTQELRALQRDGIVERKQYPEIPPRVEYTLTELGESLAAIFSQISVWLPNMHAVEAARCARRRQRVTRMRSADVPIACTSSERYGSRFATIDWYAR